jgi:hypothetical protein
MLSWPHAHGLVAGRGNAVRAISRCRHEEGDADPEGALASFP